MWSILYMNIEDLGTNIKRCKSVDSIPKLAAINHYFFA